MPRPTRWFIKAALAYLVAAGVLGVAIAARGLVALPAWLIAAYPTYLHLFMFGWLTQLIFGVAFWMFPRERGIPHTSGQRAMEVVFVMLNAGLLLRAVAEPQSAAGGSVAALLLISAALQWIASAWFAVLMWPRVLDPAAR